MFRSVFSTLALLAVGWAPMLGAQQNLDDVEIHAERVAGGVYMLTGAGGNIGLSVGDDGPFLVDDQYAPLTERIQAAIAELTQGDIRFIVNTHWHGDHTGGNENLGKAGALIVAHENVRKRMSVEQFIEAFNSRTPAAPEVARPVITFTEAVTFYWNGDRIDVFHVAPAHTDGDAVIHWIEANVVHMGDTYFSNGYPFIDVASGGTIAGMVAAVDTVLTIVNADTRIIPGHGPVTGVEGLEAYRDMLATVRDRVQRMISDGMSEDDVVAAKPTREFDAEWVSESSFLQPDQWVRFVYQGLAQNSD